MAKNKLRPKFLSDIVQILALSSMDFLATKNFGLTGGVAYLSVQTDKGQNGIVRFHIVDPNDRYRRMKISTDGFHPIDFFGDGMKALVEAMKQHASSEAVSEEVQTSFPGAVKTQDVGGHIVSVGFAGGTPKENEAIADFGLHILQVSMKN